MILLLFGMTFKYYFGSNRTESQSGTSLQNDPLRGNMFADIYGDNRIACVEAKNKIFQEIMFRADRWASKTGWAPGESDM